MRSRAGRKSKGKRRLRRSPGSGATVAARPAAGERAIDRSGFSVRMAMVLATLYTIWVIVVPPEWLDTGSRVVWLWPRRTVYHALIASYHALGFESASPHALAAGYLFVTAFIVPLCVVRTCRIGKLADLGWRRPNRFLPRIVVCSFCFSIPFLFWMVSSPGFAAYYRTYMEAGVLRLAGYYAVALFCEHSFFDGILLAVFRRGHKWPVSATMHQSSTRLVGRLLQWFGVAQPTQGAKGWLRLTRWFGLPDGAIPAILLSGFLFGMVHLGKDGREFLLAFPGGVFLASLAYRCNSWHAPYILHISTALAAGFMLWLII